MLKVETVEVDDRYEVIDVTLRVPSPRQRRIIAGVVVVLILLIVAAPTGLAIVVCMLVGPWLALVLLDWPRKPNARLTVEPDRITASRVKRLSWLNGLFSVETLFRTESSIGPEETMGVTTRPVRVWESDSGEPERVDMYFVAARESRLRVVSYVHDRDEAEQLAEQLNEILRRLRPANSSG